MTSTPFLSAVDEARLNIRGSRDPLGLVPLWGHLGRSVVGNLTTATTSVRGFTAMMLGYYFADELDPKGREGSDSRLKVFLKFEQLSAYARWHVNEDGDLRGITEVKRRLEELTEIPIASDSSGQILANQKTYGLWGLYTMPSRASDLIEKNELTLTPLAREFIEKNSLRTLEREMPDASKRIRDILAKDRSTIVPDGADAKLLRAIAAVLDPKFPATERAFYREYLVLGRGGSCRWQEIFAVMVEEYLPRNEGFCLKHLGEMIKQAQRQGHPELAHHLERIRAMEALLVPLAMLFSHAQARDGAPLTDVVKDVSHAWGKGLAKVDPTAIEDLVSIVDEVYADPSTSRRFVDLAEYLRSGDYANAILLALQHNEFVMRTRGGAEPWVVLRNKRLDVRFRDGGAEELASASAVAGAWRNGYYLNPLKIVSDQLRGS